MCHHLFVRVAACISDHTSPLLSYNSRFIRVASLPFFSNLLLNPFPPFCYCNQLFKIVWSIKFYKVTWFVLANLTHNRFHNAIQTAKTLLPGARHIPITSEDCGLCVRDWNLCSC